MYWMMIGAILLIPEWAYSFDLGTFISSSDVNWPLVIIFIISEILGLCKNFESNSVLGLIYKYIKIFIETVGKNNFSDKQNQLLVELIRLEIEKIEKEKTK